MKPEKSFTVAFISDLHIDSYLSSFVKLNYTNDGSHKLLEQFIDETLQLQPADILVLAGDISHYLSQTKVLLECIVSKKLFKKIFVVSGNHEMYLIPCSEDSLFKKSIQKIDVMKNICSAIDTVEFLDGNIIEVDGVKIAGAAMFYDFSYGFKQFGLTKLQMLLKWRDSLNDANYIKGNDIIPELVDSRASMVGAWGRIKTYSFDPLKYFESEKEKLEKIIDKCDIFISHVGPVVSPTLRTEYQTPITGCFYFDGEKYLLEEKAPKLFIFGHTHDTCDFKVHNTTLLCNPLGYKSEKNKSVVQVVDLFNL